MTTIDYIHGCGTGTTNFDAARAGTEFSSKWTASQVGTHCTSCMKLYTFILSLSLVIMYSVAIMDIMVFSLNTLQTMFLSEHLVLSVKVPELGKSARNAEALPFRI